MKKVKHEIILPKLVWENLTETEQAVDKIMQERWVVGRKRYGEGISFKQYKCPLDCVIEAIEECADQLQYLVALKLLLEEEKGKKK